MNSLQRLQDSLRAESNEVLVDEKLAQQAMLPLNRMLSFAADLNVQVKGKA